MLNQSIASVPAIPYKGIVHLHHTAESFPKPFYRIARRWTVFGTSAVVRIGSTMISIPNRVKSGTAMSFDGDQWHCMESKHWCVLSCVDSSGDDYYVVDAMAEIVNRHAISRSQFDKSCEKMTVAKVVYRSTHTVERVECIRRDTVMRSMDVSCMKVVCDTKKRFIRI